MFTTEASSLGQLNKLLFGKVHYSKAIPVEHDRMKIQKMDLMLAAADHCLKAAYSNNCPGVNSIEFRRFRMQLKAVYQKRDMVEIERDCARAILKIQTAKKVSLSPDTEDVADLRWQNIPELVEAAAQTGIPVLATPRSLSKTRHKITLKAATKQQVSAFLTKWAVDNNLVECYGDAYRGFAGGYLVTTSG